MPRKKKFDETQVLEKAMEVFWEKGYHATSYCDLVTGMGINRASMYNTYGDKHQLFVKAIQQYRQQAWGTMDELLNSDLGVKEKLTTLFESAVKESVEDPKARGCFLANTASELAPCDLEIEEILKGHREKFEEKFTQLIKEGQEKGEITNQHEAHSLARFIYNTFNGLRVIAKTRPPEEVLRDIQKVALSIINN